jgi:hypothetical protein
MSLKSIQKILHLIANTLWLKRKKIKIKKRKSKKKKLNNKSEEMLQKLISINTKNLTKE